LNLERQCLTPRRVGQQEGDGCFSGADAPQFLRLLFWRTWVLRGHTLVAPQNWS